MRLSQLLARFSQKNRAASYKNFDRRLISGLKNRKIPSWQQLKYLGRFLSTKEKRTITTVSAVLVFSLLTWLGIVITQHIAQGPKSGGEYIEAMIGQPKYINPIFSLSNEVDTDISSFIYSGLMRYSADNKLIPNLAASVNISDDKKTYAFTLRKDVKWSDGQPFTASDVAYTFEMIQNVEVGSPLASAFQGVTVEQIDNEHINFTLKEPFAPFLGSLTVGILPEHIWSSIDPASMRLAKNNLQPVGTGPWKFSKMVKDDVGVIQSYTLVRNEEYFQKIPHIKTLTFKFFVDYNQAFEALRGQTVSAVAFLPNDLNQKISSHNFTNYPLSLPQYTALFFNEDKQAFLKDSNLRLALSLGTNKNSLVKDALDDHGTVINSPILPGQLGYYPELKTAHYSTDEANALLDKNWTRIQPEEYFEIRKNALFKTHQEEIDAIKKNPSSTPEMVSSTIVQIEQTAADTARAEMSAGQTFYRKNKDGKILSLTITTADTVEYKKTAEVLARQWNALGIATAIQTVAARQINREAIKNRDYQILLYSEIVGADPDLYPFWHSGQVNYPGLNLAQYSNRNADKILETARVSTDNTEREKLYRQFQDILNKDLPALFLYTPSYNFVVNKEIKGVNIKNILSQTDRYNTFNDWFIKTSWSWK